MTAQQGLDTEFADSNDSTGLILWRVSNAWQAAQRRALKPFGLTHVQFVLLAALTWLDGNEPDVVRPITQQALAAYAHTDPMMTSQVLRMLEKASYIERTPNPRDGRARQLAVTAAGRALVNQAVHAVEACDREYFAALGGDRAEFTRLLARLTRPTE